MSAIKNHFFNEINEQSEHDEPDLSQYEGYDAEMKKQAEQADKDFIAAMEKHDAEQVYNMGVF